jgi:methylmalonyl-CoA mutase
MTESDASFSKPLHLLEDFPPVPTSVWEAAIQKDLKGAEYEKKLVWKTDEGISVRPYYRAENVHGRPPVLRAGNHPWEMVAPGHEPPVSVNAIEFHEAGATAVQEVAFALALGADLLASDTPVETFSFAIGSNHFMEISKLRAARLLWAQVAAAFGAPKKPIRIHARTAGENKTLYDPYMNLLRVTTEALSAIIGGCDSLTISPCRFDAHLASNVHHILREEVHLDKVADPAAGSYYVECLTEEVAREAWKHFQEIEAAGGFAKYKAAGKLEAALAQARGTKEKAVVTRRRVFVGTNNYPNIQERALDAIGEVPQGQRLASIFEAIRLRTERHAKKTGKTPRVLLLERGDLKMRKARTAFSLNFFGCAGFNVVQSDVLAVADLIVLCSSDAEYLPIAQDVCPKVSVPVLVAGNPKDQIDALRAAGVADFVHVLSNPIETFQRWQERLGIKEQ